LSLAKIQSVLVATHSRTQASRILTLLRIWMFVLDFLCISKWQRSRDGPFHHARFKPIAYTVYVEGHFSNQSLRRRMLCCIEQLLLLLVASLIEDRRQ
jgi:hypothetical protein